VQKEGRRDKRKSRRRRTPTPSESESESESESAASSEPEEPAQPPAEAAEPDPLALAGLPPMTAEEEAQFKEYLEKKLEGELSCMEMHGRLYASAEGVSFVGCICVAGLPSIPRGALSMVSWEET
jgi:hypothetical protein